MFPRFDPSAEVSVLLDTFAGELDTLIKTPKDMEKTIGIMEKLLTGGSIESMRIPEEERTLVNRVMTVKNMMDPVNAVAREALRGKMQGMVADKVEQLRGLQACKELCRGMIPELSPDGSQFLITTVEGFYQKGLSEDLPPKKALSSALVKGMLSSFISEPDIDKNTALRLSLESKEELQDYICGISRDFVGSDAVFLLGDEGNVLQRYHRSGIEKWFIDHDTDPISRAPRTSEDIVADPKAEQVIKKASRSWIDSKLKDVPSSLEVRVLMNKGLLLTVAAAYPLVKEKYETILKGSYDTEKVMEKVELFTEEIMSRFTSLAEGINTYVEQVPPPCYPYIEEFIRQAAEKAKPGVPSEGVKHVLEGKMSVFIDFFRRIDSAPLSPISKEGALAIVGEAISKDSSLDQIEALFLGYMDSIQLENRVRKECPGCLMGGKEWSYLGVAQKIPPLTEKILAALHETSPSDQTKKAWQTGVLLLVPEFVNKKPLTLNGLGELMKKDFPNTETGYRFMSPSVAAKYGENPAGKSEWVLVDQGGLPDSRNKDFQKQDIIKPPYELPELLPMIALMFLKYLNSPNKERLFSESPLTYTRCKETIEKYRVVVGGFTAAGLKVHDHNDYDYVHIRFGSMRKFCP